MQVTPLFFYVSKSFPFFLSRVDNVGACIARPVQTLGTTNGRPYVVGMLR